MAYGLQLQQRAMILRGVREFFWARNFLEVETPIVLAHPSQEPYLEPLRTTFHDERDRAFGGFLRMSPEFSLKKVVAAFSTPTPSRSPSRREGEKKNDFPTSHREGGRGGVGDQRSDVNGQMSGVFEIGPVFRDGEPWGGTHNPEFTMIEWYRRDADYRALMKDCEALCTELLNGEKRGHRGNFKYQNPNSKSISKSNTQNNFSPSRREGEREGVGHSSLVTRHSSLVLSYQGQRVDLTPPWERLTMREAWRRYAHLDLDRLLTRGTMVKACATKGYTVPKDDTFDDLFFKIHLTEVEPKLGRTRPTFLTDWPVQMAGLARKKPRDPRYAERVELYIGGLELANGFSELTDADEQLARFRADQRLRRKLGKPAYPIDMDFIAALRRMPPTAGIALGIDRLVMLLTDSASIADVRLFSAPECWGA